MLCKDEDGLIRYNYLKIIVTKEDKLKQVYKILESF